MYKKLQPLKLVLLGWWSSTCTLIHFEEKYILRSSSVLKIMYFAYFCCMSAGNAEKIL